jgi:hypothetical protein
VFNTLHLIQSSGSGLTLGRILRDIPHDGAAILAYVLVATFVYLIWKGSRPKKSV